MGQLQLTQIYSYPIKSCRGISHERISLDRRGLHQDRRWMLVDSKDQFITQRQLSEMSLLQTQMAEGQILVDFPGQEPLTLPVSLDTGAARKVRVWDDECLALEASASVNNWFSQALGQDLRLVYMPESTERHVDPDYARETDITSFSEVAILGTYRGLPAGDYPKILLDFSSVEYINSSGIALIITMLMEAGKAGQKIVCFGLTPHFQKVFEMVGLKKYTSLHATEEEGLAALQG